MSLSCTELGRMKEIKDTHFSRDEKDSSDLIFYACGNHSLKGGMSYGPVVRNYYVIHFVSAGKGTLHLISPLYTQEALIKMKT